jgi:2,4-dienoyl-CoA reductase (NADPH2)
VRVNDAGLHIVVDGRAQVPRVDSNSCLRGPEPRRDLLTASGRGADVHLIGADICATELTPR